MKLSLKNNNGSIYAADEETAQLLSELPFDVEVDYVKPRNTRTAAQNRAMHLFFGMLAKELNDSGQHMNTFPWNEGVEIDWTPELIKEHLWKPVQEAVTKKDSTAQLDKKQVSEVYEILNRHLADKTGVSVRFPSFEDLRE